MGEIRELAKKWDVKSEESTKKTLKELRKIKGGLRGKISVFLSQLEDKIGRVEYMVKTLQERDRQLYDKVLEAQERGDKYRAAMYANEISELRKMAKRLIGVQTVLEQVKLRVETVRDLGELASLMYHVRPLIKELESQFKGVVPELALDLHNVNEALMEAFMGLETSGIISEAPGTIPAHLDEEARKVLEEATVIAESRVKNEFPKIEKSK